VSRVEYPVVAGATAFVEVAGEGQPLLCVHSAGQTGLQWREVLRDLPSHGYQVIVPDLPGHGRSDMPPGGPVRDLGVYRAWLAELLSTLGVPDAAVVGCSIGGKLALDLASRPEVSISAAVAMAADARNRRLSLHGLELGLEDASSPSRADRTYYGTLGCIGRAVPADRAEAIATRHRREDPIVSTSDLIGWTTHDLTDRLAEIRCPVRLVVGTDDFWLDPVDAEWAAQQIERCTFELLEGVGHYPMEELDDFPQLLVRWLHELSIENGETDG
jgi:pimeloyl-ACP methyl ester carboxylesterase